MFNFQDQRVETSLISTRASAPKSSVNTVAHMAEEIKYDTEKWEHVSFMTLTLFCVCLEIIPLVIQTIKMYTMNEFQTF